MNSHPSSFSTEKFVDVVHGFCLHAHACHAGEIALRMRPAPKRPAGGDATLAWLTAVTQSPRLPVPRENAWNPLLQALLDDAGVFTIRSPESRQPTHYRLPDRPDQPYRILDDQPPQPDAKPGFTYACSLAMPPGQAVSLAHHATAHLPVEGGATYVLDLPGSAGPQILDPRDALQGAVHRTTLSTPHGPLEFGVFESYANFTLNAGGRLRPIPLPTITPAYVAADESGLPQTPPTYYCRVQAPQRSPLARRYWHDAGPHDLDLVLTRQLQHLAKRAIYSYFAANDNILPTCEQWEEARGLDVPYPEPRPILNPWTALSAEAAADQLPAPPGRDTSLTHAATPVDPGTTVLVPNLGTSQNHILAQALRALPQDQVFAHANDLIGDYSWYQGLQRVTRIEAEAQADDGERVDLVAVDTSSDDFPHELIVRRVRHVHAILHTQDPQGRTQARTLKLACAPLLEPSIYPRGYLFVTPACDLDLETLRDIVVEAGFQPLIDAELDTPDTQHDYHAYEVLHTLSRALETPAASHQRLITHLVKTQVVPQLSVKLPTTVHLNPDGVTVTVDDPAAAAT